MPFIFFPRRVSPVYYDLLIGLCQSAGFTPDVAYEVEKVHSILSLVVAEAGVSFVPRSVAKLWRTELAVRELSECTATAQVVAAYRPNQPSVALEGLLAALREPGAALAVPT